MGISEYMTIYVYINIYVYAHTHTHHNFSVHFKHMRGANVHLVLLIFLAKTCSKPTLFLQCSQHFPADWCIPNIPTMVFCCIFPNMFLYFALFSSQYFPYLFLIFFLSCPRTPFQKSQIWGTFSGSPKCWNGHHGQIFSRPHHLAEIGRNIGYCREISR